MFHFGHLVETRIVYSDLEQLRFKEKPMKTFSARSLMKASILGLAVAFVLSLILVFGATVSGMYASANSTANGAIVPAAVAAEPATGMVAAAGPLATEADTRLDEFRLHPDSCCLNQY